MPSSSPLITWSLNLLKLYLFIQFILKAFNIRLHAINDYGLVIHEFDPWFNYRATEYLDEWGLSKFFHWFDYMSWYPLGRPVGTTIYPGLQITSVAIKNVLEGYAPEGWAMSLNDVCCYVPAWFGAIASILTGILTLEVTKSHTSAVFATGIMGVVPAHLMRSIGGGYDNESIALTAMMMTFLCWVVSLRSTAMAVPFGIATGFAYIYMVAAWGGYVFVLNMVGVHAAALIGLGRFSTKLHISYSLFYLIGTYGAIQIPVVGWTPLKSLEQLGPCAVFLGMQVIAAGEYWIKAKQIEKGERWQLRFKAYGAAGALLLLVVACLPGGYFGPLSSRIRGLFVQHTRTGNPLVDSVAEHQPASPAAYYQYLNILCNFAPIGFLMVLSNLNDQSGFLILYAMVTYFFSAKMVRLIILTGPIAAILGGYFLGYMADWSFDQLFGGADGGEKGEGEKEKVSKEGSEAPSTPADKKKKAKQAASARKPKKADSGMMPSEVTEMIQLATTKYKSVEGQFMRKIAAVGFFFMLMTYGREFVGYCDKMAVALSNPSIMFKAQLRNGQTIIIDDYREAYWWLRDNTPEDSRVMAWWDYGYQITGIANRTTVADGNTWNHEHIALLGRCLTSPEKEAHRVARHLADYVLIWAGGGGDDLAKSPHMARIANSVYRDVCPGDPTCRQFGFTDKYGTPTPMMEASLLYKLHGHNQKQGVTVDPNRFREVFTSKYGKVRIFKVLGVSEESKSWVADPSNRDCDVEGGWFCRGVYPPALETVLSKKKDFAQLEDFNAKRDEADAEAYQKAYMENMRDPKKATAEAAKVAKVAKAAKMETNAIASEEKKLSMAELEEMRDQLADHWEDNEVTTRMWELINAGEMEEIAEWIGEHPQVAYVRSSDGRGPMFWAFEAKNEAVVKLLMSVGVKINDKDKNGKTPRDM
ncbi:hypothetical protein TrLO_g5603 [Triparma laevis f. longispina]|uniref:dolichyl-diphosphooligosaccharide--protein glycotransferase n=1 Tax=Triparma laevis f. longispina TaxID=1714387 RepID=A0A9W7CCM0_9STRA|nr:hypothetical protein TrLO_g5603 [Triparma laevis f. longispina]